MFSDVVALVSPVREGRATAAKSAYQYLFVFSSQIGVFLGPGVNDATRTGIPCGYLTWSVQFGDAFIAKGFIKRFPGGKFLNRFIK